jgi:hypothetical protein
MPDQPRCREKSSDTASKTSERETGCLEGKTAEEIARSIDAPEDVFHVLRHLASNDPHITRLEEHRNTVFSRTKR